MLSNIQIAIWLAFLLGLFDYLSEGALARRGSSLKEKLVSFAAGVSVSYIFLHLFPLVYSGAQQVSKFIFIFMLAGFVIYHLIEKWIYKHEARDEIVKDVEKEHTITLFVYHFIIGVVFIAMIKNGLVEGLFYFAPVSLHVIINALPHSHKFKDFRVKAFFAGAPLLGALFGAFVSLPVSVDYALLGLIAGLLLFLEAREVVPEKRKGSAMFFILGVLIYGVIIVSSWGI